MTEAAIEAVDTGSDVDCDAVERAHSEMQHFTAGLSPDELDSGSWFAKLVKHALSTYSSKADWQYFQRKYPGVPAKVVVDQRIKMASRYAGLAGGLSAGAHSALYLRSLGPRGGAGIGHRAAGHALAVVNAAYLAQLQLRLVHDISVLYRVPFDVTDPDDMWDLVRTTFLIRGGTLASTIALQETPELMRSAVKSFYSGSILTSARQIPAVGAHLLQRNVINVGVAVVGVPLVTGVNYFTTRVSGRYAQRVCGNKARVIELAHRLSRKTRHPQLMLWVAHLVVLADRETSDLQALLLQHLVKRVRDEHQVVDKQLAGVIVIDAEDVWERIDAASGDLGDVLDAARQVAAVDGRISPTAQAVLSEIEDRCRRS
jgi:tellurite resistance protein